MRTDTAGRLHGITPEITLGLLYELLDSDPHDGLAALVHRARVAHYTLPALVLSVLEKEGVELGTGADGELRRARHRAERYAGVLAALPEGGEVIPLKGSLLAGLYPSGVLRAQGDVDLFVRDEAQLWRTATALATDGPSEIWVTVMGPEPTWHLLVSMVWPNEEPVVEPEYRVELANAALLGDFAAVGVRPALPADTLTAVLLCLAEERLQRSFHPRDVLDLYVLRPWLPAGADVVAVADDYRLAPELLELCEYASRLLPQGDFGELSRLLSEPAGRERERRAKMPDRGGPLGLRDSMLRGQPVHGLPLRHRLRGDLVTARTHWIDDQALLHTPVGDYLLTTDKLVSEQAAATVLALPCMRSEGAAC
ncbi:nucleotidyltransferase family protein [Streptomyces tauricus]|uniref:Nucleotidyltransferase family protein n=1 Tax=Streptomyces tauricus TaxID=68274 RepID=A0ABZ1JP54_9ACTN|nr:hypothetical protein [Streptomyces tauricus]